MIKRVLFLTVGILSLMLAACETKAINNGKKENKMKTIELTKADFLKKIVDYEKNPEEWIYLGDKPAIIDFYASWCGPCKMVAPVTSFETVDCILSGGVSKEAIWKVNTEQEQELAALFNIRSIPSFLFIPMNDKPQMAMGAMPKSSFKEAIDGVLLKK